MSQGASQAIISGTEAIHYVMMPLSLHGQVWYWPLYEMRWQIVELITPLLQEKASVMLLPFSPIHQQQKRKKKQNKKKTQNHNRYRKVKFWGVFVIIFLIWLFFVLMTTLRPHLGCLHCMRRHLAAASLVNEHREACVRLIYMDCCSCRMAFGVCDIISESGSQAYCVELFRGDQLP